MRSAARTVFSVTLVVRFRNGHILKYAVVVTIGAMTFEICQGSLGHMVRTRVKWRTF